MLDKKLIFRRINFIVFISYSLLSILNDLNITTIPLPIDLSVCIVLFLCFNSIFEQNNDSHKNNKLWKFHCHVILEKCKDHLILIDGVEFSCRKSTISISSNKKPQHMYCPQKVRQIIYSKDLVLYCTGLSPFSFTLILLLL